MPRRDAGAACGRSGVSAEARRQWKKSAGARCGSCDPRKPWLSKVSLKWTRCGPHLQPSDIEGFLHGQLAKAGTGDLRGAKSH
jgi:hypothetical protein